MKVFIKGSSPHISIDKMVKKVCFWLDETNVKDSQLLEAISDKLFYKVKPDYKNDDIFSLKGRKSHLKPEFTLLARFVQKINRMVSEWYQKDYIKIDNHDIWSLDVTLAKIIVPSLILLKEKKHGAPLVDNSDVPQELWMSNEELENYNKGGKADEHFFERFDYVLNEMIFAFTAIRDNLGDYSEFSEGDIDFITVPIYRDKENSLTKTLQEIVDRKEDINTPIDKMIYDSAKESLSGKIIGYELVKGENHTRTTDKKAYEQFHSRVDNGLRLFAKYYRSLWD